MSEAVRDHAARHLQAALGHPVDTGAGADDTDLAGVGLDSLLAISVLVGVAEDYGVDLAEYVDTLDAPGTVGDLIAIAERFHRDGARVGTPGVVG